MSLTGKATCIPLLAAIPPSPVLTRDVSTFRMAETLSDLTKTKSPSATRWIDLKTTYRSLSRELIALMRIVSHSCRSLSVSVVIYYAIIYKLRNTAPGVNSMSSCTPMTYMCGCRIWFENSHDSRFSELGSFPFTFHVPTKKCASWTDEYYRVRLPWSRTYFQDPFSMSWKTRENHTLIVMPDIQSRARDSCVKAKLVWQPFQVANQWLLASPCPGNCWCKTAWRSWQRHRGIPWRWTCLIVQRKTWVLPFPLWCEMFQKKLAINLTQPVTTLNCVRMTNAKKIRLHKGY